MRIARWIFAIAGVYGLVALLPGYFSTSQLVPPPNHLELYYGFYGCALAWQFAFFAIAFDPIRYRMLMPVTVLEKVSFFVPCLWLYHVGRLAPGPMMLGGMIDGVWMVLFSIAWLRTPDTD